MTTDTLKPEELRIGNWLLYDEDGKWTNQQVKYVAAGLQGYNGYYVSFGWATTTLQCDISNFDDWELYVKGIPLTPEILEKCGFEWDIFYQGLSNGRYVINILNDNTISFSYGKRRHDEMQFLPYIKHLHQLQNLYYALTQTELQIQL